MLHVGDVPSSCGDIALGNILLVPVEICGKEWLVEVPILDRGSTYVSMSGFLN